MVVEVEAGGWQLQGSYVASPWPTWATWDHVSDKQKRTTKPSFSASQCNLYRGTYTNRYRSMIRCIPFYFILFVSTKDYKIWYILNNLWLSGHSILNIISNASWNIFACALLDDHVLISYYLHLFLEVVRIYSHVNFNKWIKLPSERDTMQEQFL